MTDSTRNNLTRIAKWFLTIVHGLAILVGVMAALFGSQADASPWESRSALILGGALLILGLAGVGTLLRFSTRVGFWSGSLIIAEIIAFVLLLNFGP